MALVSTIQDDFSSGIYTGRKAPPNAVYDLVNGLVNDEGLIFRRGGTAYKSGANSTAAIEGLADAYLAGGQRTVFWSETAEDIYVLDSNDSSVVTLSASGNVWRKFVRGVVVGGLLWFPATKVSGISEPQPLGYGGSRKTSDPSLFSADVTNGSKTVTGSATSWMTTADAGMIFEGVGIAITGYKGVVARVIDNTTLELVDPWTGPSASGSTASLTRFRGNGGLANDGNLIDPQYLAAAGRRLLMAQGSRVYFTDRDDSMNGSGRENYHQLPSAATIIGADSINDVAVIFTTAGVWAISNLVFDPVDDYGNIQHAVEQVSKDVILWGDPGIAAWSSALVVPAVEDVYIFSLGEPPVPITGSIRNVYRSYVASGYQPGLAAVHRGHYFLPILNGTSVVDTLVCRLDRGSAWTTWAGHASGGAYTQRIGSSTRSPKLLGINGQRVTDLTGCLDPSNATDADGTTSDFELVTRDYPTGQARPGFAQRFRARYELTGPAATVTPAFSSDQDDDVFTDLTEKGEQGGGDGWSESDGSLFQWAIVGKRRDRIRFRLRVSGACSSFVLRSVELLTRPSGRQ